jgi:hypothetical protein
VTEVDSAEREKRVRALIQELSSLAKDLQELSQSAVAAAAVDNINGLLDTSEIMLQVQGHYASAYRSVLVMRISDSGTVHVGHEMSST